MQNVRNLDSANCTNDPEIVISFFFFVPHAREPCLFSSIDVISFVSPQNVPLFLRIPLACPHRFFA
ncbi:MAG TPA: hypothetical protein DDX51_06290 [Clostridiales bacterium]|nr:hypothetical protein [Clostridiales bacterium]